MSHSKAIRPSLALEGDIVLCSLSGTIPGFVRPLALILLLSLSVKGWCVVEDAGQPGAYLLAGVGGRAGAMGNAYAALAEGPEAVYWNPAALALGGPPALASTYNILSLGRQSDDAELQWSALGSTGTAGSFPMDLNRGWGSWGLGWMGFSLGDDFEGRVSDTPGFYTFGDHEDEYALAHGRALLPWLALGVGLKLYDQTLSNYTAHGEGLDLGSLVLLGPWARLAVTANDLFSNFTWSTGDVERFPITLRASLAASTLGGALTMAFQAESVQNLVPDYSVGVEGRVFRFFRLRAGLQQYGFTFGGGASVPVAKMDCSLDYAYMPDPLDQGSQQRFSLDLSF
jgi:hypothetical protein